MPRMRSRSCGSTNLIEVGKQDVPLKVDLPPLLIVEAKHAESVCVWGGGGGGEGGGGGSVMVE